jgi:hypothetical protein
MMNKKGLQKNLKGIGFRVLKISPTIEDYEWPACHLID